MGVGSDIGGSIRLPAFFNGIFGHKSTVGKMYGKLDKFLQCNDTNKMSSVTVSRDCLQTPTVPGIDEARTNLLLLSSKVHLPFYKFDLQGLSIRGTARLLSWRS